jgi:hypothetical protein
MDPAKSMLDADSAAQVRAVVAKGAMSPGVIATISGNWFSFTQRGGTMSGSGE